MDATQAEAAINISQGLSVTVRLGEVETVEHTRDKGLGITVYFGQRTGSASTTDLSPAAVRDSVRAACTIAKYTAADDCAGLADPALLAREFPDLGLYHPWNPGMDQAIELARACEAAAREADRRITNSEGATLSSHAGLEVYGNSHGFLGSQATTRHGLSVSVIAQDASGMQRDYWYSVNRAPTGLEAPATIGREAARRAVHRLGGRKLTTRRAPVVFEAPVASSLLSHFVSAVRGSSLYRQASFLLDSLGKPVFAPGVHLHEQPHLPGALGSAVYDSEGVATRPRDVVRAGVLLGYVLDSYSARKLKLVTTGNAGGVQQPHAQAVRRRRRSAADGPAGTACAHGHRTARDRVHRFRCQYRDRRLLARRRRFLGRKRRDPVSGRGDHRRRQPQGHVPRSRRRRRRRGHTR